MARDGNGNYSAPHPTHTAGTVISSSEEDANIADWSAALTQSIAVDGQSVITGNIPFAGNRLTGLGAGVAATDSANIANVQGGALVYAGTAGGTNNALTLSLSPAITAYTSPLNFIFKAGASASDDAVTIAVNGLSTVAAEIDDAAFSASVMIEANKYYSAFYDGTAFQLSRMSDVAVLTALTSADIGVTVQAYNAGISSTPLTQGKHTIGLGANGLSPTTTAGCEAIAQAETTTNAINYWYLAFAPSSTTKAFFWFPTPKSYNASTFTMRVWWTHPATVTNFDVDWTLKFLSLGDGDAIDTAAGTAISVTDTGGTTEDFYLSPESAAITPSNTPAKQDVMYGEISRDGASDNLAVDAHLLGIEVYYTLDAGNDE